MDFFDQEFVEGIPQDQMALFVFIAIWELVWKGFALWKAARKKDTLWFVLLLALNTAGLLPALYIFYISKRKMQKRVLKVKLPTSVKPKQEDKEEKKEKSAKKAPRKKK